MGDGLDMLSADLREASPQAWQELLRDPLPSHLPDPREELATQGPAEDNTAEPDTAAEQHTRSVRTSDPHEFAALYMAHRWSFMRLAGRYLSDTRDCDEVVQEAFLRLFLALPELDNELVVLSYCRRTISNLCIDRLRAEQRRPRLVSLSPELVEEIAGEQDPDPVEAAEDAVVVREALALLSPLHREALIKREIEEKPLGQIGAELDIPAAQVKHVLHRARRALRRLLVGSSVEPGTDLSLGVVLAANRERAERAARSTAALVLVMVLSVLGLLGLLRLPGEGGEGEEITAELAMTGAQQQATFGPTGRIPGPATEGPGNAGADPKGLSAAAPGPDSAAPGPGSAASSGAQIAQPPPGSAADQPPPAPEVAVAEVTRGLIEDAAPRPAALTADGQLSTEDGGVSLALVGVDETTGAALRQVSARTLASGGMETTSTVVAQSPIGWYALSQHFVFAADGSLAQVGLAEQIPTEDGPVRTEVPAVRVGTERLADGGLRVQVTGLAQPQVIPRQPQGEVEVEQAAVRRKVAIDVLFSADRSQILAQSLKVTVVPAPQSSPSAQPSPSTTPAPTAAPTSPPATLAPTSSASASPSPAPSGSATARPATDASVLTGESAPAASTPPAGTTQPAQPPQSVQLAPPPPSAG